MTKLRAFLIILVLSGLLAPSHAISLEYPDVDPRPTSVHAASGKAGRWDVCTPIEYSVNWTGAPRTARRDLLSAVHAIESVTGLRFRDTGQTPRIPRSSAKFPRRGLVVIGWTSRKKSSLLERGAVGTATSRFEWNPNGNRVRITRAYAVFDAAGARGLRPGFGPHGLATLILHELMHVVGLDHTLTRSSVMYPSLGYGSGRLSAGDKRALRRLYPKSLRENCGIPDTTTTEPEDPEFDD